MKRQRLDRVAGYMATAGIILFLGAGTSQATPIGLTGGSPDIFSGFLTLDYTTGNPGTLSVTGTAFQLNDGSTTHGIAGGTFDLTALIDTVGSLTPGASSVFTIGGTIAGLGFNSGTLLTGSLNTFGFDDDTSVFEFLFDVTGGDAASLFGSGGGMILSGTGYPGNFEQNFGSGANLASADTFGVPEPSTLLLMSLGLFGAAARARRRTSV